MYVPRTLHKAIDSIDEIAIKKDDIWNIVNFVEAAKYYEISPYTFFESFINEKHNPPDKMKGKYQYYAPVITIEDKKIKLDLRIVRRRDNLPDQK